jgi:hypothetical protein
VGAEGENENVAALGFRDLTAGGGGAGGSGGGGAAASLEPSAAGSSIAASSSQLSGSCGRSPSASIAAAQASVLQLLCRVPGRPARALYLAGIYNNTVHRSSHRLECM